MSSDIIIKENTQPAIGPYFVGVGNIWERDTPDANGVIARRMTATVAATHASTKQERTEQVFAGSVLTLGDSRYAVVDISEGHAGVGSITLRKIDR